MSTTLPAVILVAHTHLSLSCWADGYRFRIPQTNVIHNRGLVSPHASRFLEASNCTVLLREELRCMCLLAGHAGTGFSVISSNPTGPAPVRNLHAALLAPRRLYNLVRGRLGHVTVLPAAPRCSYGTARQGSPQQLTCIAVCCPSAAVTCACHCHRDTAVCHGDVESAASASFLTRPLTALSFAVGASLLLLAAQPSSAEALQVKVLSLPSNLCIW